MGNTPIPITPHGVSMLMDVESIEYAQRVLKAMLDFAVKNDGKASGGFPCLEFRITPGANEGDTFDG